MPPRARWICSLRDARRASISIAPNTTMVKVTPRATRAAALREFRRRWERSCRTSPDECADRVDDVPLLLGAKRRIQGQPKQRFRGAFGDRTVAGARAELA